MAVLTAFLEQLTFKKTDMRDPIFSPIKVPVAQIQPVIHLSESQFRQSRVLPSLIIGSCFSLSVLDAHVGTGSGTQPRGTILEPAL